MILFGTDADDAPAAVERIRERIAALHLEHSTHVTCSIGTASTDSSHHKVEARELLGRADDALYEDKRERRRNVIRFRPKWSMGIIDASTGP